MTVNLFDSLATTGPLAAVFSDQAVLAAMIRFEVALARAEAAHGAIPGSAAETIARVASQSSLDASAIAVAARHSGTIAVPFVELLTARVNAVDPSAATYVHWGATSQDVSDTAMTLCLVEARRILDADCARLSSALRRLSDSHASTVMLARTLLQPSTPTTFGLKAAFWHASVRRANVRLRASFDEACVLQFGGPSGTLASIGDRRSEIAAALGAELSLRVPAAPWHAHRDRLAALVGACGVCAGTLGKIARDVSLLMQHEVREASEPGGGSSSMPQKRNPAGCAIALAAATRLPGLVSSFLWGMVQEHERAVGGWHAEAAIVPAAVQTTGSALAALADVMDGLTVDPERMLSNLRATNGAVYAERAMARLGSQLGRQRASAVIAEALAASTRTGRTFQEALAEHDDARAALGAGPDKLEDPDIYADAAELVRVRLLNESFD